MSGADPFGQQGLIEPAARLSLTPGSDPIIGNVFTKQPGIITPTGNFSADSWQRMRQYGNARALNTLGQTNKIADVIAPAIAGGVAAGPLSGGGAASGTAAGSAGAAEAGTVGAADAGMAGGLGSGMYGVPLAENGAMMVGPGGAVSYGGTAAGELGSGMSGIAAPTAAETASPWYANALENANKGYDYYKKADSVAKATQPQQQQQKSAPPKPIFQGEPTQISPFANQSQSGNGFAKMLMNRRLGLLR